MNGTELFILAVGAVVGAYTTAVVFFTLNIRADTRSIQASLRQLNELNEQGNPQDSEENRMPNHQSTTDYIAARKAGDGAAASQIVKEVVARFSTRETDGTEIAEVFEANLTVPLNTD